MEIITKQAIPDRHEVAIAETWDLESVFPTTEAWEVAFRAAEAMLPDLAAYENRVEFSAGTLLAALRQADAVRSAVEKIGVYAGLRQAEDATNTHSAALADRARGLGSRAAAAGSFLEPEIAALPDQRLDQFFAEAPELAAYRFAIARTRRQRAHIRSTEVEEVLARSGEVFGAYGAAHDMLEDGELPLGTITDEGGQAVSLAQGNLNHYLQSADRRVRQEAWIQSADSYLAYQRTFGAVLTGAIKRDVFLAKTRRYDSSLAAALDDDNVPTKVFFNLIDTVWQHFPTWHRYFKVRRRLLDLPEGDLHGWDLEAPLAADPAVPWDDGVGLILASLAPLGEEYVGIAQEGMAERWVDRAANLGKGGGAFSSGVRGTHPFISMTYQNTLSSVSTLTHEIGHSLHSYLTWRTQPVTYAEYGMSAAETASNFNQALLGAHLLGQNLDRAWTIAVIEERMANFLRYFFIMPILARFELWCHEQAEAGEALTAEAMSETLLGFYRAGYGGEVVIDEARMGITWARFPHLFANFYVFQYGVGISAAATLATAILDGEEGARDRYLAFLRTGGSQDPIAALAEAGVDMRSPAPIERAFALLDGYVDRLEGLVE